jgi:hypothetical protein
MHGPAALRVMSLLLVFGCNATNGTGAAGDDDPAPDASTDAPETVIDPCATPVVIPTTGRPVVMMPPARLAEIAARVPCIGPGPLRDIVESSATYWYDKHSLIPGYQDSFGDNVIAPIGMRPNTIDPGLINLAVPGGHQQVFSSIGVFHFPFGSPIGPVANVTVVNFWRPVAATPVVWWRRDPNQYTHRIEWMFPAGTVFGEMLFMEDDGVLHPFEIRTRTRTLTSWQVDVFRPFPRASDLADTIEAGTPSPALAAVAAQLRAPQLAAFRVAATHFTAAFAARDAGIERLPALTGDDADTMRGLLRTTAFRSARGIPWQEADGRVAWAAGAAGGGQIVPQGYNAAAFEVSETSCDSCHRDAGRPFETWYSNILAYGELWGNDETFTWHPFTMAKFVDAQGRVVNFNYDQRELRPDLVAAGLLAPYQPSQHPASSYQRIVREWTDFAY